MYTGASDIWEYGNIYEWDGEQWVKLNRIKNAWKVMDGVSDLTDGAEDGIFTHAFCQALWAQKAFITELQTKHIILEAHTDIAGEGGIIQSRNYNPAASPEKRQGFIIRYDGKAEFQEGTFRGTVHAIDGDFSGALNAKSIQLTGYNVTPGDKLLRANNNLVYIPDVNLSAYVQPQGVTESAELRNILRLSVPVKVLKTVARGQCKIVIDFPEGKAGSQWSWGWFNFTVNGVWQAANADEMLRYPQPNGDSSNWSQAGRRYTKIINLSNAINEIELYGYPYANRVFINTTFELRCAEDAAFLGLLG